MRFAALTAAALLVCLSSIANCADEGSIIFSDDFSTLDPGWRDNTDYKIIGGGKAVLKSKLNMSYSALYQGNLFGDCDIRVKIACTDGPVGFSAGLAFWAADTDNFYVATLYSDGKISISRWDNNKLLQPLLPKLSDAVKKGLNQTNEMRVVTKGTMLTLYINGTQVASLKGFPPAGDSQIGLYAESGDKACTWEFTDLVVRKPQ